MSRTTRILLPLIALVAALLPVGLGSTAYADGCGTLHAADVAYGAPLISGSLDEDTPTACYVLDLPGGTPLQIGSRRTAATIEVRSGSDRLSCGNGDFCNLTGNGPFRLDLTRGSWESASFDLRVLALTPQSGCPVLTESALGAADRPLALSIAGNDVTCASVDLSVGAHLLHTPESSQLPLSANVVDSDGGFECRDPGTAICSVKRGGPHVLSLAYVDNVPYEQHFTTQIVDVNRVVSCPVISGSWSAAPSPVPASGPDVACRMLEGARSGDRYAVATGTDSASDDDNWNILGGGCERSSGLGCTLTGNGPYRVITWGSNHSADYRVVARRVDPGSDCPATSITPFGAPATDDFPGVGCRTVPVQAGQPFVVLPYDRDTGYLHYRARLYSPDFAYSCIFSTPMGDELPDPCELDESGDVTVITDLFGADTGTYVYDPTSSDGCTSPSPTRLRTHETELAPQALACEHVDQPAGAVVTTYQRDGQSLGTASNYVDATGARACAQLVTYDASCRLYGTAPFRLLLGADGSDLHSVTLTAEGLGGCPTRLGEGPSAYEDLPLTAATSLRCLKVPTKPSGTTELVHAYRTGGGGSLLLALHDQDGVQQARATTDERSLDLASPAADDLSSVVVLGTPTTVRVARAIVTDDEIVNWRRPRIFGDVRAGNTVIPATGQWSSSYGSIHPVKGTWLLDGREVSVGKTFAIPRSAAGKVLVLRVTAYGIDDERSRTVDSVRYPVARP